MKTTRTLIILDGWGIRKSSEFNAIAAANTPVWDRLLADYPNSRIVTSGMAVGLPAGQMGNSEVGHMNLGAGRTVYQHFTRINKAVQDGSFVANRTLQHLMLGVAERGGALHVLGLLSEGGVHSHASHIEAVCAMAASQGLKRVYVHAFLDGRDTPPRDSSRSISNLECMLKARGCGRLVSIIGRYYAMDRDQRWERTEKAWRLIVEGQGERQFPDGMTALRAAYACGEDDEFVAPTVIAAAGEKPVTIAPDDSAVFMNFRPDRARQLVHSLIDTQFEEFPRLTAIAPNRLVTLTPYSDDVPCKAAFIAESLRNGLGEYLANTGRTQLRIAETEKYAHVTFFFNGGREKPFAGESRILVPSPNVASYDLQPEMSAPEVTDRLVAAIRSRDHDLIVCNFANGDMVGHTGSFPAAVKAVEALDSCLGQIVEAVLETGGECLISADHGNVEKMYDHASAQNHTAHTTGPVPLVCVTPLSDQFSLRDGSLCDIAPTLLELMRLPAPVEMTGRSLLDWKR